MKQFWKILKFELMNYFKNKVFIGATVFLVVAIAVVMFIPKIIDTLDTDEIDADTTEKKDAVMLIKSESPELSEAVRQSFEEVFPDYEIRVTEDNVDTVKSHIISGDAECAFVMKDASSYTYYVNNLSMYDMNTETADSVLQNVYRMTAMVEGGLSLQQASDILSVQINSETESLGKDQGQNYWYTYIMIFALYIVIMLYGQMVATNVATEKSSRAMEVLITSAKPVSMMFGKVIASCIAGFLQLVSVFGSAILFYNINKEHWGDNPIISSVFDMPSELLMYMLIFFVLGFLIYAFLYGAIGSTASKLEDINTSVQPLTFMFVIAFFVVFISMTSGSVDNPVMKICSYVPFTSPMAMFTRIAMSTVPWYEILISIVILIGSVFGIGVLSAKIYRAGVLMYGTTPKLSAIIKSVLKA